MEKFAARILELREAAGLSQDALGKEIGVKRYSIYSYEKGKGIALADYFGVSLDYLVGRSDER